MYVQEPCKNMKPKEITKAFISFRQRNNAFVLN